MIQYNHQHITQSREAILVDACQELVKSLRQIEPLQFVLFFKFGEMPLIYEKICAIVDQHFTGGCMGFACTGIANMNWQEAPSVAVDLEFSSEEIFAYFRLFISDKRPKVEIHHIVFQDSAGDPDTNTRAFRREISATIIRSGHSPM